MLLCCQNLLLQSLLHPTTELHKINPEKVPDPKDFMGWLVDVEEGDNPDEWPANEHADSQLMLWETQCYASFFQGFVKEVLMNNDFDANSGRIKIVRVCGQDSGSISGVHIREQL
jgi:hypothetical protein